MPVRSHAVTANSRVVLVLRNFFGCRLPRVRSGRCKPAKILDPRVGKWLNSMKSIE